MEAHELARALGRGINIGDALEAPREGDWGVRLDAEIFARVRRAGFDTVRLPVRWSNQAATTAPYRIDEAFFQRVDFAIAQALAHGLRIVVNMHHYRQLDGDPLDASEKRVDDAVVDDRFVALWAQVAERYRKVDPTRLLLELYNEPHNRLDAGRWNRLLARGLAAVRSADPDRYVVVGPADYNKVEALERLSLPLLERRLIVTVHLYEPYEFTHQGAPWVEGSAAWLGTPCCSSAQRAEIERRLDAALGWSRSHYRPIWVGEFGAYEKADRESRVRYTTLVREAIEARGFSWAYWELASRFGIYEPARGEWRGELLQALVSAPSP